MYNYVLGFLRAQKTMERKNKLQSIKYKTRIRDGKENSADCMCFSVPEQVTEGEMSNIQVRRHPSPPNPNPPPPASLRMK